MRRLSIFVTVIVLALLLAAASGCGGKKEGTISQDQHSQIQRGMTLDQVEAITGLPQRTHSTGTSQEPVIIWSYEKTDASGLVRITFTGGKVESVSPYDESIEPEE